MEGMLWKELRVEEQRLLAVREHDEGASIAELAETLGVARKRIYKWLERYQLQGLDGERSLTVAAQQASQRWLHFHVAHPA